MGEWAFAAAVLLPNKLPASRDTKRKGVCMNTVYSKLVRCCRSVQKKIDFTPRAALVLGSGLGDYGEVIDLHAALDYCEIEDFPVATVPGHKGRFLFGEVKGVPVVAMQGRIHYYEGYAMEDVVLPVRLMKMLGAEILILTNSAGGLRNHFQVGDLMLITDQIANFVPSPLIGPNIAKLGQRFTDMSRIYNPELKNIIKDAAARLEIPLQEGTYIQLTGPNYETPKEVAMCRMLGADAVGMSTACEAIAAHHMGMKICGISCISNLGCGMTEQPLDHQEVQLAADLAAPRIKKLITESIKRMAII